MFLFDFVIIVVVIVVVAVTVVSFEAKGLLHSKVESRVEYCKQKAWHKRVIA